ncbi:glycosyltransferase family 25 protein [Celeribacter sp.]|uniref:glycosyltransferase family 25 protein n=1 Tax=Celeribacter sp. TaxID=1890673 RepID=UPI003A900CED
MSGGKKSSIDRAFIVHLERAVERRPQVDRLIDRLPVDAHVIPAIDGSKQNAAMRKCYVRNLLKPRYPFALRDAEIATFMSHRKCWQYIVDEGLESALIVEDDVEIDRTDFDRALDVVSRNIEQGDLIRFPIRPRETARRTIAFGAIALFQPDRIGLGMVAQIVTAEAAKRLLERTTQFDRPVDTYLQLEWDHGVRVRTLWPSGVEEVSENLGGSLIGTPMTIHKKLRHEILRPIYRLQLKIAARRHRKTYEKTH